MNIPIHPIHRLGLNQCPKCEGILVLVEKSISMMDLDKRGIPKTNNLDDEIEIKLICTECKSVYDADKEGMHYLIKRSSKKLVKEKKSKKMKDFNPFYS